MVCQTQIKSEKGPQIANLPLKWSAKSTKRVQKGSQMLKSYIKWKVLSAKCIQRAEKISVVLRTLIFLEKMVCSTSIKSIIRPQSTR